MGVGCGGWGWGLLVGFTHRRAVCCGTGCQWTDVGPDIHGLLWNWISMDSCGTGYPMILWNWISMDSCGTGYPMILKD